MSIPMFRKTPVTRPLRPVEFRWALDETQRPVSIGRAQRGVRYTCPLCQGPMVARLGEQVQHHYSHEYLTDCTVEGVARAAMRRWIACQVEDILTAKQRLELRWQCRFCGQEHTLDLVDKVVLVAEDQTYYSYPVDVLLLDQEQNALATFFIYDEAAPMPAVIRTFAMQDIFVIALPSGMESETDLNTLIKGGQILSGPCPTWERASHIIQNPEMVRAVLRNAVNSEQNHFYGPIETVSGLAGVLRVGNRLLWLPPDRWQEIIGGTRNPLAPGVQVWIRDWMQANGSVIYLYYVIVRDMYAVGVRRYSPGVGPVARLDERFRKRHITALDVARYLVTH